MWLIGLAVVLAVGLSFAPLAAEARQAGKIPRLCFLELNAGLSRSLYSPFFQGLRDLGYVDGQTITIDYLSADGQVERFPTLAADCVRLKRTSSSQAPPWRLRPRRRPPAP